MMRPARATALALLLFGAGAAVAAGPMPARFALQDPAPRELSGLAAGGGATPSFWAHNDSGHRALLYRFDPRGRSLGTVRLPGVRAQDWEDLAAFDWRGQRWLAVADTGDNFALRREVSVLLLPEPDAGARTAARLREIRFRYPDGARDVEALAFDAQAAQLLLLEKRRPPARLYALEIEGPDRQIATPLATLPDWWPEPPQPVETLADARYRGAVTAMDLSSDGRHLALLSLTHVMVFARAPGEPWSAVFARAPRSWRLPRHDAALQRVLYEALAWGADGCLWVSGEAEPPPLLRYCDAAP